MYKKTFNEPLSTDPVKCYNFKHLLFNKLMNRLTLF